MQMNVRNLRIAKHPLDQFLQPGPRRHVGIHHPAVGIVGTRRIDPDPEIVRDPVRGDRLERTLADEDRPRAAIERRRRLMLEREQQHRFADRHILQCQPARRAVVGDQAADAARLELGVGKAVERAEGGRIEAGEAEGHGRLLSVDEPRPDISFPRARPALCAQIHSSPRFRGEGDQPKAHRAVIPAQAGISWRRTESSESQAHSIPSSRRRPGSSGDAP
jgi:hypothetical protein